MYGGSSSKLLKLGKNNTSQAGALHNKNILLIQLTGGLIRNGNFHQLSSLTNMIKVFNSGVDKICLIVVDGFWC